ncbi:MAG TPA: DUF72 domain-containing protein [Phycisphaerae bacterium]|nr:DUF72 domain-containing protein [Phycisphaerae bacterium]
MTDDARRGFRIGPSGWSYPDWTGIVYPARRPRGFRPLAFIATLFDAVEVNTSFYAIPSAAMTERWPDQVGRDFRFAFKLTRTFTHERATYPPAADARAFIEALAPIRAAGRIGPLLIQFPWSFRYDAAAAERLRRLADDFAEFERFIEVRHASWAQPEALAALAAAGGCCNIDQPRLPQNLPPTAHVLGRGAYVRLHGRNAANWFAENREPWERYDYLYDEAELREWVARLNELSTRAEWVYVFANNHYRGQGVANALELRALLEGARLAIPPSLIDAYPRLSAIALPERQRGLFDHG